MRKTNVISKIMTSGLPNKLKLVNNFKDNNSDSDTIFSYIIPRFSSQKKIQKLPFFKYTLLYYLYSISFTKDWHQLLV